MGHVRSVGSVALQLLRSLEEMLIKGATHNLVVRTRADVALYVLNHKRAHLRELETRFRISIAVNADPTVAGQQPFVIERGEQVHSVEAAKAIAAQLPSAPIAIEEEADEEEETAEEAPAEVSIETEAESERKHRRRRRRRRGGEDRPLEEFVQETAAEHTVTHGEDHESEAGQQDEETEETEPAGGREATPESREDAERRRRRRGRRGGRRNRRERDESAPFPDSGPIEPELTSAVVDFDRPWMPSAEAATESAGPPPQAEPAPREEPSYQAPVTTALVPPPERPVPTDRSEQPPPEQEMPRRRSTVREPAPFVIGSAEAPAVPPPPSVAAEPTAEAPEDAGQPRRTGWWSRRLMGGNKG
jgi:ribonuclease E